MRCRTNIDVTILLIYLNHMFAFNSKYKGLKTLQETFYLYYIKYEDRQT